MPVLDMVVQLLTSGRRLALAGLIAGLLAPGPALAGDTATLTVRARVVDDCHVRLPDLVPRHARRHLPDHVRDLIVHRCRGRAHPRITGRWWPWPLLDDRHRPKSVTRHHHHGRNRILITISY